MQNAFLEIIAFVATKYTRTYINVCVALGYCFSFLIYGVIGYAIGAAFDHGSTGMQLGCALVAFWSAANLNQVKDMAEIQIEKLEQLKKLYM